MVCWAEAGPNEPAKSAPASAANRTRVIFMIRLRCWFSLKSAAASAPQKARAAAFVGTEIIFAAQRLVKRRLDHRLARQAETEEAYARSSVQELQTHRSRARSISGFCWPPSIS